jgi:esterase/lipase superfamily enzyme
MIDAISSYIEDGKVKVFTVDSVDNESWANWNAHPADRARRHEDYDRYILQEVVPFIRNSCGDAPQKVIATGVSMGAYHAGNFFFRHPDVFDVFDVLIAISGLFQLRMFVGDYMDDNVYFNTPLAYLPNLTDDRYLDLYRQSQIIVCVGQGAWEDAMLGDAYALKQILESKGVPAWIDIWGGEVNHDWPWWRQMMPYFLGKLDLPSPNA